MNIKDIRAKYPQYEDMSDEQLAQSLHAKFYADMPYEQFSARVGISAAPPKQEERGVMASLGRQLGLTARAGIGGIAAIPNAIADPVVGVLNKMGADLPIPSQALERTMTRAGLPAPDGASEEFAQAVTRGMVGPAGVAKAVPQFAQHIGTQIAAAGAASGASDVAKQMGAGPMGQFASGILGGIAPTSALLAAQVAGKSAINAMPGLIEPLTNEGRRVIAARAVQNAASDKTAAFQAASAAPEYVPGSRPTLAQASGDTGLGLMEKAIRSRNPTEFAAREMEQDAARQAGLSKVFGKQTDITLAEEARDAATKQLRDAAFANAKKVNTTPITNTANTLLRSGGGKRQEVERAMEWVKGRLDGESSPERIYAVRQDINDIIAGKLAGNPEKASLQLAAKELGVIKSVLDQQLEKSAPGFGNYLKTYAGMSREIDKARLGQEIAKDSVNTLTERLSSAGFTRQFEKRGEEIANAGPVASDALTRVALDLRRAAAPMAAGKTPGSDTAQNLVANNVLQRAGIGGGGPMQNAVSRGMGLLYRPFGSEEATQQLLRDAFLDPEMGKQLLSLGLTKNPKATEGLLSQLLSAQYGGLLGLGASQ